MIVYILGGSIMNDRNRIVSILLNSEAFLASLLGVFIIELPVVRCGALRL